MAAEHEHVSQQPAGGEEPRDPPTGQTGFALLGRRISAWTTKILLTLIILVAGFGFGRQVLRWWATDAAEPPRAAGPVTAADGLGDPARPHVLQFGNQRWSIGRQTLQGDAAAVAAALRTACRERIEASLPPDGPPTEAEKQVLAQLKDRPPVEQQERWLIHQWNEGLPMAVGIRIEPDLGHAAGGNRLAHTSHRVVIWGLAVAAGPDTWSVYTFQPGSSPQLAASETLEIPLPPESKRLVSVRVADGGAITAFAGPDAPDAPDAWRRFYTNWFGRREWKSQEGWVRTDVRWRACFTSVGEGAPQRVDVQFGPDGRGQLTGLIMIER
jgi:hypothetical protein